LEALARHPERGLPFAFGCQIADHRAGAQFVAVANDTLADPGVNGAPVAALQHDFTALSALAAAGERIGRWGPSRRRCREKIMKPRVAADELGRRRAEPGGKRAIDKEKPARAIDRIAADWRVFEKIDELVALVADHRLHLVARGDVLQVPKTV